MEMGKLLSEFVAECGKSLNIQGILQFGSSTHSENFDDVDLALFSKDDIFSSNDYIRLFEIIKNSEKKSTEVVFDIGGGERKRKGKYSITIVPINKLDIELIKKGEISLDSFFFKNLSEDKDKKVLYGKDPIDFKIRLSNLQIAQTLSIEVNHTLRKCLDDNESRKKAMYYLFKTTLRLMLSNVGALRKEDLLNKFEENYKIDLPKNSIRIIKNKISDEDFRDVLLFSENCLLHLSK